MRALLGEELWQLLVRAGTRCQFRPRALAACVLPTPGDARRNLLARDLGPFLHRWNPAEDFDGRLRAIYPPGPFDDRAQDPPG
ncbi:hypothetical protein FRAAL4232 [Frankia alni ACN14a]|uniref:Uncharacterized protein n=2 Tax=Frankiaceae TaxID=74712 RepID=Q0RHZ8_FRAAA|nr:hypothetical protein FRAAL4232 [Frankia alni ACN14a]